MTRTRPAQLDMDVPVDGPQFNWEVRVYYEDTDAAGLVYHTNYLKYMERARTEWLRSAGYSQSLLATDARVVFVIASLSVDFITPARFDELLKVRSAITYAGGSKLTFRQSVTGRNGELKCRGDIQIVCIDPHTFKPKRIPEQIKAKLT